MAGHFYERIALAILLIGGALICGLNREHGVICQRIQDAPAWTIAYGREPWQTAKPAEPVLPPSQSSSLNLPPTGFNAGEIIDRVTHAFERDTTASWPCVHSRTYQATFDGDGLRFVPRHPDLADTSKPSDDSTPPDLEARFRTVAIRQGSQTLYRADHGAKSWSVLGNTAQVLLDPESGWVEHYEARSQGVAVTWILRQPPAGQEALLIEAELAGLSFARQTETGLHFADASGVARVRIGQITAVDTQGQTWKLLPRATGDTVQVEVPAELLGGASYPLAIDPLIGAEFGMDQPVVSSTPSTQAAPSVAANGTNYLVVWTHGKGESTDPGIYGARVSLDGRLQDPFGIVIGTSAAEQAVARVTSNGSDFLVVWSGPSRTSWDIYGARVSPDGTVLNSPALVISGSSGPQSSPALAANGNDYLVVWRDGRRIPGTIYGTLVSKEGTISAPSGIPICTAANEKYSPAVAALGTNYLVVWQDYRRASSSLFHADIYGARVAGNGVLMDTNGIAICAKTNSQWSPAVACNGTNCLVVWEDYSLTGNDIHGARVSADGVVLETNGIPISTAFNLQAYPAVTAQGGDFWVAWQDYRNSSSNAFEADIYATRVLGGGSVLDTNGMAITFALDNQEYPAVASQGPDLLVVWQDARNNPSTTLTDIYGCRIGNLGSELNPPELAISVSANVQWSPSVAGNGSNYLVVWADNRNLLTTGFDIFGVRMSGSGEIIDLSGIPICAATGNQVSPALVASGADYLVVWSDGRNSLTNAGQSDLYGARINSRGEVLDTNAIALCTAAYNQDSPAVAANGDDYFVVWQDARNSLPNVQRWDIFGARVTRDGTVRETNGFSVSTSANNQITPAVTGNGTDFLVVWTDYRGGAVSDIYGARVAGNGVVLDAGGFPISTAVNNQTLPAIAANGLDYWVVWADARNTQATGLDIYGARVNRWGQVIDPNGIAVRVAANHQTAPAVVANGSDYFVVWQEARDSLTNNYDLYGVSINGLGVPLDNTILAINSNANHQVSPAVAGDSSGQFLVLSQGYQFLAARIVGNAANLSLSNNAPVRLHSPERLANGQFQFILAGEPGPRYAIEASDNLSEWIPLDRQTVSNGVRVFVDAATTNLNRRFYRAITLP